MRSKIIWILLMTIISISNFSCAKKLVYNPDSLIEMYVGKDKYLIPLKYIQRPDTGGYPIVHTDTGLAYFFWPSGRGLNQNDIDPNVLEKDSNIIKVNWTETNSGIIGNSMAERVKQILSMSHRAPEFDRYNLIAYKDVAPQTENIIFIGKINDNPSTILCHDYIRSPQDSYCQLDYVQLNDQNHISLFLYGKHLENWESINKMAIQKLHNWRHS